MGSRLKNSECFKDLVSRVVDDHYRKVSDIGVKPSVGERQHLVVGLTPKHELPKISLACDDCIKIHPSFQLGLRTLLKLKIICIDVDHALVAWDKAVVVLSALIVLLETFDHGVRIIAGYKNSPLLKEGACQ